MKSIRAKSVCVFRHQGRVLLTECFDPAKNEHYLMPIGGGFDFGEKSAEDQGFYQRSDLTVTESDGQILKARWFDSTHIQRHEVRVYPNVMKDLLL